MNLNQLKYFCAVYTYQSVSAAAAYLHISQPSLSASILELENEFGIALFHRHHRGMAPTQAGETLFPLSQDLLRRADGIETIMRELGNERTRLRLGMPPMIGTRLYPHLYSVFLPEHPDIRLEITEGGRQELLKKLSDDDLDMLFLPHDRPLDGSLAARKVARLEIVCCACSSCPVSDQQTIYAQDLANTPIVLFKNSYFQTETIRKLFAQAGVEPNVLLQSEQLSTIQSLIAGNAAVGFLFRELADTNPQLVSVPIGDGMFVDVSLAWKKNARMLDCMRSFRDYDWSGFFS